MNFLLDENFPKAAHALLESKGHKVFDIRSTEHEGLDDNSIFSMAQKEQAIFLTTDKDFYHTIPFIHKIHSGIIVIALHQPNRFNILEKLEYILENYDLSKINSKVLLLRDKHYTIL